MGWLTLLTAATAAHASGLVEREHACAPDLDVDIDLQCGSVTVRGAADRKTVRITGKVDDPDALSVSATPGRVAIDVDPGSRRNCAELVVEVPARASIDADAISASVAVADVLGRVEVETVSGGVTLTGAPAAIDADSVSGAITVVGAVPGETRLETVSGAVHVRDVAGPVYVDSVSGAIEVATSQVVPLLELGTMSSAIGVTARIGPRGAWTLDSHTGAVTVTVPTDTSAAVSWSTFSGRVECSGASPANQVTFGAGDGRIRIETFTGPIKVVRSD